MSDIIYTPPASGGGGTTINPTNNRIPKRQNATTFVDSVLENGTNYLYSNYGGYTGLGLDFANFVSYLGDWTNLINGTSVVVNDATQTIYTLNNGVNNGLIFDFNLALYRFGDIGVGNNIAIDGNNQYIQFALIGNQFGIIDALNSFIEFGNSSSLLKLDWANRKSVLGDYNGSLNSIYLQIDHNNDILGTYFGGGVNGLYLDFQAKVYKFGDIINANNKSRIIIDDSNNEIDLLTNGGTLVFESSVLQFDGSALQSNTSSGNSGEHLVIILNGNQYKIKLELP